MQREMGHACCLSATNITTILENVDFTRRMFTYAEPMGPRNVVTSSSLQRGRTGSLKNRGRGLARNILDFIKRFLWINWLY